MKKIKSIKRQDSGFKLSYGNSGETSLNLSNEIFDFISEGNLRQGEEKNITFRIYKEDCIKAMSFVIMKLPLYKTSSNYSNKVENYLETFGELYSKINTFFGNNKNAEYKVTLFYRIDGRIYLKGLRVNGFSIRDYLVENYSALQFDDERDGVLNLRILSNVEDKGEVDDYNGDQSQEDTNNSILQISSVYLPFITAIKTKPFLILGGFSGTGKSQKVKELAFMTCPNDEDMRKKLSNTDNTPGNYCLVSVRPNWHDSSDLLGYYSSINDKYIVTDFVRFLVKAMQYPDIPFFVCLDEMNLAPVEEYFAEFLSVLESRKKVGEKILTDALVSADWFNRRYEKYNIFDDLGLKQIGRVQSTGENLYASTIGMTNDEAYERQDIVEGLKEKGLCLPQNVIVIGTVNMDDTTNSFSRKVIDRAMTFETVIEEFGESYYKTADTMAYGNSERGEWKWILADEVKANEAIEHMPSLLENDQKMQITGFVNEVNDCLKGSPFQIAYRILNETILYYRAQKIVNKDETDINNVFDDILMQKVLPRIEGDYDKTYKPLNELKTLVERRGWKKSQEKIDFMRGRLNKDDHSGFTSFWN